METNKTIGIITWTSIESQGKEITTGPVDVIKVERQSVILLIYYLKNGGKITDSTARYFERYYLSGQPILEIEGEEPVYLKSITNYTSLTTTAQDTL